MTPTPTQLQLASIAAFVIGMAAAHASEFLDTSDADAPQPAPARLAANVTSKVPPRGATPHVAAGSTANALAAQRPLLLAARD